MGEFFPQIDIKSTEAEAIARGLFAVAKADGGMHEREAALIAEFCAEVADHGADLAQLERSARIEGSALAMMLPSKELRSLFLKTAVLLAYADGAYGAPESKVIAEFAKALDVSDEDLRALEGEVKDYMLSQLSDVKNTDAVVDVARELKI